MSVQTNSKYLKCYLVEEKNVISQFFNNSIILICQEQLQDDIYINSINRFVGVNVGVKEARNGQTDKVVRNSQTDKAKKQRTSNVVYKDVSLIEEN